MRLNNLGIAIVAFVVGAVTVPTGIYFTHSVDPTPPKAHAVAGHVQFFPRSSDSPAPPFYKVGDHLICDDIILDSGEHRLGDHLYLASYVDVNEAEPGDNLMIFAPLCTLSVYDE